MNPSKKQLPEVFASTVNNISQIINQSTNYYNPQEDSKRQKLAFNSNSQDAKKLIKQLIMKGKRNYFKNVFSLEKLQKNIKITQIVTYLLENPFISIVVSYILQSYYKQRRLGNGLRGLNCDLIFQIQNQIGALIQCQLNLWQNDKSQKNSVNLLQFQLQAVAKKNQQNYLVAIKNSFQKQIKVVQKCLV